ncbi:antibiotic biosynthesis monooxygenase [Mycobacterium sp. M1]|uniref:Antibiotic biosynthesis monooxygenase n=1 Tax=Mycolicibacter acidiphilus TaxID=2835306 RepID=A0ABS5RK77_9MYCO|nr:putative quinol monooxygenase [Mycolicibacter acidiphilus]MBS9534700.1 antibiotic biosynthesis monooxygenase [Mycolicibacter acidiphilus]
MIFIVVKFQTKPEWAERWPQHVEEFTAATRAEPGNLWFDWSRSLDDPCEYVLVEAFRDQQAGTEHVSSAHFTKAMAELPRALTATPKIISQTVDATDWSPLAEMSVD